MVPSSTHASPSRTARVRIAAASLPASASDRQYENTASPRATGGRYRPHSSTDRASSSGTVPSLFTAGMSDEEAHARATSSITMAVASASAPTPPKATGMCGVEVGRAQRVVGRLREFACIVRFCGVRRYLAVAHGTDGGADRGVLVVQAVCREFTPFFCRHHALALHVGHPRGACWRYRNRQYRPVTRSGCGAA